MPKSLNLVSAHCGKVTPGNVEEYVRAGGYESLKKALSMQPCAIVDEVMASGLRGRGGAAFSTGSKWGHLLEVEGSPKYVVCNADEGEPGTFKDKLLLEKDPLCVIEGMTIAGRVFDSHDGYIYIRGEYRAIQHSFQKAIDNAVAAGYLGDNILGSGFCFHIHVMTGAGAYVCGENSALLNSIEGKVGRPRIKPPHLAEVGLFQSPTLVNNVETFASIPPLLHMGGEKFHALGTEKSGGTKLVCLSGHAAQRGVYEVPFGISLRDIIYDPELGGGVAGGKQLKFFHLGGQSGPIGAPSQLDTPYSYEGLAAAGLSVGSGAVVVADESVCIIDYLKGVLEFFIHESCGKCIPCQKGIRQMYTILCKLSEGKATAEDMELLKNLAQVVTNVSFCGLGQTAAVALMSAWKQFGPEFDAHLNKKCPAGVCKL